MSHIDRTPYIITLHPGRRGDDAARRCSRYIIDRWMPGNAGGIHLLVGDQLSKALSTIYDYMTKPVRIRVTIHNNIPNLEVMP